MGEKMRYFLARVSSKEQSLARQLKIARDRFDIPDENVFCDKMTGSSFDRPQYKRLKEIVKAGDEVIVKEFDRFGRDKDEMKRELQWFKEKGVFRGSCYQHPPHLHKTKPIRLCKSPKISKITKRPLSEPRLCYNQLKAIRQRKEELKMRKRIVVAVLMAALTCLLLMGAAAPAKPLDLVGNWEEKDKGDSFQAGYIKEGKDGKDGEIVIYWVSDGGDTKSLYWAGTYVAPKDNKETYSWTSKNNKDKTDHALLASGDDTKVFTYEKGEITYKASALGTTKKMHFVRTDTNYCDEEEEKK